MTRIEQWTRPNIRSLVPYSSAKDEFSGENVVFLDANENPFGTLNRYPDPQQRSLKAVLMKREKVNFNQLFVGNGSDEVIDLLLRIFCSPGEDKIATFSPTYGMYEVSASINNLELVTLPLDSDFDLVNVNYDNLLQDSKIKVLFICSPNNPTGNDLNRARMLELIEKFQGIVCIDEAYIEFSDQKSLVSLINTYDNLIVTKTFSKARGLAGARVGYAFANEQIIQLLNKVKPPYNISSLSQAAAIKAMEDARDFEQKKQVIITQRACLIEKLQGIACVSKIFPSAANFILIQVKNADALYQYLRDNNIIVRNRSRQVENCLRISIGTPEENSELINALKRFK